MEIPDHPRPTARWDALLLTPKGFGLLLAGILAVVFWPVVSGAESFFYRDYGVLGYPFVQHAKERLLAGEFPWWNPYSNTGAPFAAQWGTMCFYPGSLVYVLLPLPWALGIFSMVHLWFAGMGMRWLAVKWTDSPAAGAVAAFAFLFNGAVLASLMWPNWVAALAWMPWIVGWMSDAAGDWRRVPRLALAGAAQLMTGVPELAVFTWLAGGVLALGLQMGGLRNWLKAAVRLSAAFVLVLLLGAAQLVPFLELLENSQRAGGSFSDARWPMPLTGWANLFVPLFRSFSAHAGQLFQFGQEFLSSYYFPLGAWLAVAALAGRAVHRRFWLLAGLTMFALWMALGPDGGLFSAVRAVFPPIAVGRFPVKFAFLALFALPLLAAAGVKVLMDTPPSTTKRLWLATSAVGGIVALLVWLNYAGEAPFKPFQRTDQATKNALIRIAWLAAGAAALMLALRNAAWRTAGLAVFCGTLLLDGLTHRPWQNPTIESAAMRAGFWPTNLAKPQLGQGRLFITPAAEEALLKDPSTNAQRGFIAKRVGQWSNLNVLERVPKVNGSSTLRARWQSEFEIALYATTAAETGPMLDFLGVAAASSPSNALEVVHRSSVLPMVTAGQAPKASGGTNALAELLSSGFTPLETVLIAHGDMEAVRSAVKTTATVSIRSVAPERITFAVNSAAPTVAVMAQTWMPGWRAKVGREVVPVLRANHAFMAVAIPSGESVVELRYWNPRWLMGIVVSLVSLLGCVTGWFLCRK